MLLFIPRSQDEEVSVKLRYWKTKKAGMRVGFPAEFTLNHSEVIHLYEALQQGLKVAEQGDDGEFLVLRVDRESLLSQNQNSFSVRQAFAELVQDRAVLQMLIDSPDGLSILRGMQASARIMELQAAVIELEQNLQSEVCDEDVYQDWCEANSWAFGNVYVMRDDVRELGPGDIVDILMECTVNGLRDVFELKRANHNPLLWDKSHRSWYWSSEASKAIGQCHRYLDVLHESSTRTLLRDHPEIVAYHPRATIVMGRSESWGNEELRGLHGLNARLHGIQIITYDQLLRQAKQVLALTEQEIPNSNES
ncbi:Shedu anti-phage system protein SduA domain-containing protein [Nonomuraea wenchangensis]|uniref:Shedu anti-phage system protein SduA domain-containing protein n=1 Tax=Nonomuraea wenchangensis TaxID=568860 RepID=UPI00384BD0A8